jgi:hypothetical protein
MSDLMIAYITQLTLDRIAASQRPAQCSTTCRNAVVCRAMWCESAFQDMKGNVGNDE